MGTKGYISYERARTQSLMCIPFMPMQSCDLICASDWRALYVARVTQALYTFIQTPSLRMHERGLGMRLDVGLMLSTGACIDITTIEAREVIASSLSGPDAFNLHILQIEPLSLTLLVFMTLQFHNNNIIVIATSTCFLMNGSCTGNTVKGLD